MAYRRTDRAFVGIDGEPSEGLSKANFRLGIPGTKATFDTDLIGGQGSKCPGLLPLDTMRKNRCGLLCGFFENGDGHFIIGTVQTNSLEWKGVRVYLTDSEHYRLPCEDYSQNVTKEQD